jgi:hypothetical protein
MNKRLTPLAFIVFVGLVVPCRAEPVAVPPKAPAPAKSEAPELSPEPRPVVEPAPADASKGAPLPGPAAPAGAPLPLLGPAPTVVDPRMGAWRQQWIPPSDTLKEGVEVPPWARPPGTPVHCHCGASGFWKACRRLCGCAACETCH